MPARIPIKNAKYWQYVWMNNLQVHLLIILKVFHFLDLVAVNGGNEEDSDELDKEQEAEEKKKRGGGGGGGEV